MIKAIIELKHFFASAFCGVEEFEIRLVFPSMQKARQAKDAANKVAVNMGFQDHNWWPGAMKIAGCRIRFMYEEVKTTSGEV